MPSYFLKRSNRIIISWVLIAAILMNLYPMGLASADNEQSLVQDHMNSLTRFKDINGHWAMKEVIDWSNQGLVHGYPDDTFRPGNTITRVEFAALVNGLFKLKTTTEPIGFADVKSSDWYASLVGAMANAGYMTGYEDNTFRPQQLLNRAEAAVILSKLIPLLTKEGTDSLNGFTDQSSIPSFSRAAMSAAVEYGYFTGYPDKTIRPNKSITRAEAVVLLDKLLKRSTMGPGQALIVAPTILAEAGTFGPSNGIKLIAGDLTLDAPGIALQNLIIQGNLVIGEAVGEGDIFLQNVKVEGSTTIKGGGQNSIHIDNSDLSTIVIQKIGGRVRVVIGGTTVIEQMDIQSDANVESNGSGGIEGIAISVEGEVTLSGDFKNIIIISDVKLTIASGSVDHIEVSEDVTASTIALDSGVHVAQMYLHGDTLIEGKGTIENAFVDSPNVSFETEPKKVNTPAPSEAPIITPPTETPPTVTPPTETPPTETPPIETPPTETPPTETETPTPVAVGKSISNITISGFTLTLNSTLASNLGESNLTLLDSSNLPVTFTVTPSGGGGLIYGISATLIESQSYTLSIAKSGYIFEPVSITVPTITSSDIMVTPTISDIAVTGFSISLDNDIAGLNSLSFVLKNSLEQAIPVDMVTSAVNSTYHVWTELVEGGTYTLSLDEEGYLFNEDVEITVPVVDEELVPVTVDGVAYYGFLLTFAESVGHLFPSDIVLRDGQGERVVITSLTEKTAGTSYLVHTALSGDQTYTFEIELDNNKAASGQFDVSNPIFVTTQITDRSSNTFTVKLSVPLAGLTTAQMTLMEGDHMVDIDSASTSDQGGSYTITPVSALISGTEYTLTITYSEYSIATATFTPSTLVNVTFAPSGSEGAYAGLNPNVLGLDASNFSLTNSAGEAVPFSVNFESAYRYYLLTFPKIGLETYTLTITKPGYDFGSPNWIEPGVRFNYINNPSIGGFNLSLSPLMVYEDSDFTLKDSDGNIVAITSVIMNYEGESYDFAADLIPGGLYTLSINSEPDTTISPMWIPITTQLSVDSLMESAFTVHMSPALDNLESRHFYMTNTEDAGAPAITVRSVTTSDHGRSYQVEIDGEFVEGVYNLQVKGTGSFTQAPFDSGVGTEVHVSAHVDASDFTISDIGPTGFSIEFIDEVVGLTSNHIKVTNSLGQALSGVVLTTLDEGLTYQAAVGLERGKDYTITIEKDFYDFGDIKAIHVNYEATASARAVTSNGFRLLLNPAIPGLITSNVIIKDAQGTEVFESPTTSDNGASYLINVGNSNILGFGKSYSVDINKPGFTVETIHIITPYTVTVTGHSTTQIYVNFNSDIEGLTAANFKVVNEAGATVPISSVQSTDGGANYTVMAEMQAGNLYWITYVPSVDYQSYSPIRVAVTKTVEAEVIDPSMHGFTLSFSEPVADLKLKDLILNNSNGNYQSIALTTTDGGATYQVSYTLTSPGTYTLNFISDEYGIAQEKYALSAPVSFNVPIPVVVHFLSIVNGTILLNMDHEIPLTIDNFKLTDILGEPVDFTLNDLDGSFYQIISSIETPTTYLMTLNYPGYDFGPAITIALDIQEDIFMYNQTQRGISLRFSPAIPNLEISDIVIEDVDGIAIGVESITTTNFGRDYRISAPLTSGTTYTVVLEKDNYTFEQIDDFILLENGVMIDNVSSQGFKLNVLHTYQFGYLDIRVLDPDGVQQSITSMYSTDRGLSYEVAIPLASNVDYTVQVENLGDSFNNQGNDYGLDTTIRVNAIATSFDGMYNHSGNKLVIRLDPAVPDLDTSNFHLIAPFGEVPILNAVSEDGGLTYILTSTFWGGQSYTILSLKEGYDFGSAIPLIVPFNVIKDVWKIGANSLMIGLNPAVPDLTSADFILKDSGGNILQAGSAVTEDEGTTYTVFTNFTGGESYTVEIEQTDYDFGAVISADIPSEIITSVTSSDLSGLVIAFSPALTGLSTANFSLVLNGEPVEISSVATANGGASYSIEAALEGRNTYTVAIAAAGYEFAPVESSFLVDLPVEKTVFNYTATGFTLQLSPSVADLVNIDLRLRDAEGLPIAISSISTSDEGATYIVHTTLGESKLYSLNAVKSGYQFGAGASFVVPVPVSRSMEYVSDQGFVIRLAPSVLQLTLSDLILKDSSGSYAAIRSLTTDDNGASYKAEASLQPGAAYSLELLKPGYEFGAAESITVQETIELSIGSMEEDYFVLMFSQAVPDFNGGYIKIHDDSDNTYVPSDVYDLSGDLHTGLGFKVDFPIEPGKVYTLVIDDPDHPFSTPVEVVKPIAVSPQVANPVSGSFILILGQSVDDLTVADIRLFTDSDEEVAGISLNSGGATGTYLIRGAITEGSTYRLKLNKKGYEFGSDMTFLVSISVRVFVSNEDTNGFTISLEPSVANLAVTLKLNGQTVNVQSAITLDEGYTYQVKTNLGANTSHLLVLGNGGYDFGDQLSVSNSASPPVLINAVTNENGNTIILNFDKPLSLVPAQSQFAVKRNGSWLHGIGYSLGEDPTQITIQLDRYLFLGPSDTVAVSYTGVNKVKAVNGSFLAVFNEAPVLLGSTPIGYATTRVNYAGNETTIRLRDDYHLTALEAAEVMREVGFRVSNYSSSIASVYQLDSLQMAQLFFDMQADGLTALKGQNVQITPDILRNLVSVGYEASIFIESLKAINYQSNKIASALKYAGLSNSDITAILFTNMMDSPSQTVTTLRSIGVSVADCILLLGSVYGASLSEAIQALKAAGLSADNSASAIASVQNGNPDAAAAAVLMLQSGYTPGDIGPALATSYSISNAGMMIQTLQNADFNDEQIYRAASGVFANRDVTTDMLHAGITSGSMLSAVKASGDADGAVAIADAFKQHGLGIIELENALQSNGYSIREATDAMLAVGHGLGEIAQMMKHVYDLDIATTFKMLDSLDRYGYLNYSHGSHARTIFSDMVKAGYDPVQLTDYYLKHVMVGHTYLAVRELKFSGISTDQALRIIHDLMKPTSSPLTIETAFELFAPGSGYFTSDEILSAVLYAFAADSDVASDIKDVQKVGLAFYMLNLRADNYSDKAKQLKARMGMTMKQWMELEKSDSRVRNIGGSLKTEQILMDTYSIYGGGTITLQDVVTAMSTSDKFTLSEVIIGLEQYNKAHGLGTKNLQSILGLLQNSGYSMQTIIEAIANDPYYGNGWINDFSKYGLSASDVAVYYKNKSESTAAIVTKLSPYSLTTIVLVLRDDLGLDSGQVLTLLSGGAYGYRAVDISIAIGYVYSESERDIAVKLLKLQGSNAAQVIMYLREHGITNVNSIPSYLVTAGFTESEIVKAFMQLYGGVMEMPNALVALQSVLGSDQVKIGELLNGASITTPQQALEFMATHHYKLREMVHALKSVFNKTSGETTSLLNKRFAPGVYTLNEIMNNVSLVYSESEESTLLDLLEAQGVASSTAAIIALRQFDYELTMIVKLLKNGYGLEADAVTELLFKDGYYDALDISFAINAVYHSNDEVGRTAQLLINEGITDTYTAVRYLADKYVGIKLTARVLNEIYHVNTIAAIDYMSGIPRYQMVDILIAVQEAYGTDPIIGFLARMKQNGASAYEIANELIRQDRLGSADFLLDTLLNLGYDKDSSMDQVFRVSMLYSNQEIGQLFIKSGFVDATSIAKALKRNGYFNKGHEAVAIVIAALPHVTLGNIALGMKDAGYTSEAIMGGFLSNEFDDSVAGLLKVFGFSAKRAAAILQSARYSTEDKITMLKQLAYPLSEFFSSIGNTDASMVAILKSKGYSAPDIAKALYNDNVNAFLMIRFLDEGGFTDLATLVKAYYESDQPIHWVIHDIYSYGTVAGNHRWPLVDVVKELLANTPIALSSLTSLINYANDNNYNQTFLILRDVSTREQASYLASLNGVEKLLIGEHIAHIVALTTLRTDGRNAHQAARIVKTAGGVTEWTDAALLLFFTGYEITDIISALFDEYRDQIGFEILLSMFNGAAGKVVQDYKKYYNLVKLASKLVTYALPPN